MERKQCGLLGKILHDFVPHSFFLHQNNSNLCLAQIKPPTFCFSDK